jgi:hypothetical protein
VDALIAAISAADRLAVAQARRPAVLPNPLANPTRQPYDDGPARVNPLSAHGVGATQSSHAAAIPGRPFYFSFRDKRDSHRRSSEIAVFIDSHSS